MRVTEKGPYLVHHHDGEQVADCREEQPVKIVLGGITDGRAEDIQYHLADDKEKYPEADVAQWPAIL